VTDDFQPSPGGFKGIDRQLAEADAILNAMTVRFREMAVEQGEVAAVIGAMERIDEDVDSPALLAAAAVRRLAGD
jgi:hypothetical protein